MALESRGPWQGDGEAPVVGKDSSQQAGWTGMGVLMIPRAPPPTAHSPQRAGEAGAG